MIPPTFSPPTEHYAALQVFNPFVLYKWFVCMGMQTLHLVGWMKFDDSLIELDSSREQPASWKKNCKNGHFRRRFVLPVMMKEKDWIVEGSSRACPINTNLPYSSLRLNFRYGSSGWETAAVSLSDAVYRPEFQKTSPLEQFWANREVFHLWLKLCHHSHYLVPVKNSIPHTCKHQEYIFKNWNALAPLKRKFTDS